MSIRTFKAQGFSTTRGRRFTTHGSLISATPSAEALHFVRRRRSAAVGTID